MQMYMCMPAAYVWVGSWQHISRQTSKPAKLQHWFAGKLCSLHGHQVPMLRIPRVSGCALDVHHHRSTPGLHAGVNVDFDLMKHWPTKRDFKRLTRRGNKGGLTGGLKPKPMEFPYPSYAQYMDNLPKTFKK